MVCASDCRNILKLLGPRYIAQKTLCMHNMGFDLFSFAGGESASLYRQQVEFLFGDDFKVVIQSRDDSRIELIQKHYVGFELCVN